MAALNAPNCAYCRSPEILLAFRQIISACSWKSWRVTLSMFAGNSGWKIYAKRCQILKVKPKLLLQVFLTLLSLVFEPR